VVEVPLYWKIIPRINNKYSQLVLHHIDHADHKSRYGMDKSAGCSSIRISSNAK
jgi:hypothetical protein